MTIKQLEKKIKEAQDAYYNSDSPIMTDAEFDELWEELKEKDPNNPLLKKVGEESNSEFEKVKHKIVMGSQQKVKHSDLQNWLDNDISGDFICQYKMDGISIELNYKLGKLISGITRGNGLEGFDITSNVIKMNGVPKQLKNKINISVRGEILLPRENLKYFGDAKNCRNMAAGLAKRLDGKDCDKLDIVCYDAQRWNASKNFKTQLQLCKWLTDNEFILAKTKKYNEGTSSEVIIKYLNNVFNKFDELDYDIDGLVLKQNQIDQEDLKEYRPKQMTALKPENVKVKTKLLNITWQMKSGTFCPIGHVEPVNIQGSTVSKASLVNLNEIIRLNIKIGDYVYISKRNMIIPHIEGKA